MTLLDASVIVSALTGAGPTGFSARRLLGQQDVVQAPAHLPAEVMSALRKQLDRRELSPARAAGALSRLDRLPLELFALMPLRGRVWALKDNLTVYDAWYVALAERLEVGLVTLDGRLARASGPRCLVTLLAGG